MKRSSPSISKVEPDERVYPPEFDANSTTVEEMDAWILSLGGRRLSPKKAREAIKCVRWCNIPGENLGEIGFPFAHLVEDNQ